MYGYSTLGEHWKLKIKTYCEKIIKKLWFLKNIIFVKTDYVFLKKKHSMVIFQRKNILWLFFKAKKQNLNFPILYKKSISGFFNLHKQNLFFFIYRNKQDMIFFRLVLF